MDLEDLSSLIKKRLNANKSMEETISIYLTLANLTHEAEKAVTIWTEKENADLPANAFANFIYLFHWAPNATLRESVWDSVEKCTTADDILMSMLTKAAQQNETQLTDKIVRRIIKTDDYDFICKCRQRIGPPCEMNLTIEKAISALSLNGVDMASTFKHPGP